MSVSLSPFRCLSLIPALECSSFPRSLLLSLRTVRIVCSLSLSLSLSLSAKSRSFMYTLCGRSCPTPAPPRHCAKTPTAARSKFLWMHSSGCVTSRSKSRWACALRRSFRLSRSGAISLAFPRCFPCTVCLQRSFAHCCSCCCCLSYSFAGISVLFVLLTFAHVRSYLPIVLGAQAWRGFSRPAFLTISAGQTR